MKIRQLTREDCTEFVRLRMQLFLELGESSGNTALQNATGEYFFREIGKTLFCWGGVEEDGALAACASVCLFQRLPYAENLTGKEAYLLNVYTLPQYRGNGLATELIQQIQADMREYGIGRIWLNATDQGRKLYQKLGFTEIENGMEWLA
ncbi:MAG: GNAT family N-acetyltransferase [Candidatus Merdivicinus sp.]|jgi:ribosomal protein S18 acetylase RimI-like enzyme